MRLKSRLIIAGTAVALMLSIMIGIVFFGNGISSEPTGFVTYSTQSIPSACFANYDACIDLDGDGRVSVEDEKLFAMILNGSITDQSHPDIYNKADFDGNGIVDNDFDFQTCFISMRDKAKDRNGGNVTCNLQPDNVTGIVDLSACQHGCPDLNGDGYVDDKDYEIMMGILDGNFTKAMYPSSDLTGSGVVDWEDRDCISAYMDRIVACNLNSHASHTAGCPDFSSGPGSYTGDGRVDEHDYKVFMEYYNSGNLKADINGDGRLSQIDILLFKEYNNSIVDCNIYHAPWHVGGIDNNYSSTAGPYDYTAYIGGSSNATLNFTASRDGSLTKLRLYMRYDSGMNSDINITIHPMESGIVDYSVIIDTSVIPAFNLSSPHWQTAYFSSPQMIYENMSYHVVLESEYSDESVYSLLGSSGSLIFEQFSTTACADINSDGRVDSLDEAIISSLPDGLTPEGLGDYSPAFDFNSDLIIDQTDYDILHAYIGSSGFVKKPEVFLDNSASIGSYENFGNNRVLSQTFTASNSKLSKISLMLSSGTTSQRGLSVSIRENYYGFPGLPIGDASISGFSNQTPGWYEFEFDYSLDLNIGSIYHIIIYSSDSSVTDAYRWQRSESYDGGYYSYSTDSGVTFTNNTAIDLAFMLYDGDSRWNGTFDLNNDSVIDSADLTHLSSRIESWDSSWWTPSIDFNAEFGVYEKLLDKILGFDAYMGKVVTCGLPKQDAYCGNGRCDEGENFLTCPQDCSSCNYDGFCSADEDFFNCPDCSYWRDLPTMTSFPGTKTTDVSGIIGSQLESVSGFVLENYHGRIEFREPVDIRGKDIDSAVAIGRGIAYVNTAILPSFDVAINATLYNLSYIHPIVRRGSTKCTDCSIVSHMEGDIIISTPKPGNITVLEFAPDHAVFNGSLTTDFSLGSMPDMERIHNMTLERSGYGNIIFAGQINASFGNYSRDISIGRAKIAINGTADPRVNRTSKVALYNLSYYEPVIYRDGSPCPSSICTKVSYTKDEQDRTFCRENGCRLEMTITQSGSYEVVENTTDTQFVFGPIPTIIFSEGEGYLINLSHYFFDIDDDVLDYAAFHGANIIVSFEGDYAVINNTPGLSGVSSLNFSASDGSSIAYSNNIMVIVTTNLPPQQTSPIAVRNTPWYEDNQAFIVLSDHFMDPENDTLVYSYSFGPPSADNISVDIMYGVDIFDEELNRTLIGKDIAMLTPDPDWFGTRFLNIHVSDGKHNITSEYFAELTVIWVNDPPYQKNDIASFAFDEDTNYTIDAAFYFNDVEDGPYGLSYEITQADNITIHQSGASFKFEPDENWNGYRQFRIDATDTSGETVEGNVFTVYINPVNDPILRSDKEFNIFMNENRSYAIDLKDYFIDVDGDVIYWYSHLSLPSNLSVQLSYLTGEMNVTPKQGWTGIEQVNISAFDPLHSMSEMVEVIVYPIRPIYDSWISGVYYHYDTTGDIKGVISTLLNITKVTGTDILLVASEIINSEIINSTVKNCTIIDSVLNNTPCIDTFIDPSDIRASNTTGSTIIDSDVWYSHVINSTVEDSRIEKSVVINSTVRNSTLLSTEVYDAVIEDEFIIEGRIMHINGSVVEITMPTDLADLINFRPVAVISVSPESAKDTDNIEIDGSLSLDRNIGSSLADSLSYSWDITGDGIEDYDEMSFNHKFAQGTHNIALEVTDQYGMSDIASVIISVSSSTVARPGGSGGGGGGGGGSSGGGNLIVCQVDWECEDWGPCIEGSQSRVCVDNNSCSTIVGRPQMQRDCVCEERWVCDAWMPRECISGELQVRECRDENSCGTQALMPDVTRECVVTESCTDGVRNQDESDVDCGGIICKPCANGKACRADSDCIGICDQSLSMCISRVSSEPTTEEPSQLSGFAALMQRQDILMLLGAVIALIAVLAGGLFYYYRKKNPKGAAGSNPEGIDITSSDGALPDSMHDSESAISSGISSEEYSEEGAAGIVDKISAIDEDSMKVLMDYAYTAISRGYSKEVVRQVLQKQGWSEQMLDELMRRLQ